MSSVAALSKGSGRTSDSTNIGYVCVIHFSGKPWARQSAFSFCVRRTELPYSIPYPVMGRSPLATVLKYVPLLEICSADPWTSRIFIKALFLGPSLPPEISVQYVCNSRCQLGLTRLMIAAARDDPFQLGVEWVGVRGRDFPARLFLQRHFILGSRQRLLACEV